MDQAANGNERMTETIKNILFARKTLTYLIRLATWAAFLAALIALIGFILVPFLARDTIIRTLSEQSGRPVSIEHIHFNPFTLTVELNNLRLMEQDGQHEALSIQTCRANLEFESLIQGGPVLHELALDGVQAHIVREAETRYNWSDLIERFSNQPPSEKPARFSIANIRLTHSNIQISDHVTHTQHAITNLALSVPFISNLPVKINVLTEPALFASIDGTYFSLKGRTKPFSETHETSFDIVVDSIPIAPWLAYLPFKPSFLLSSGTLSTNLEITFSQPVNHPPNVTLTGQIQANELVMQTTDGHPAIRFEELGFELADAQPLINKWHLSRLRLLQPEINLIRLKNGHFNLAQLLPPAQPASSAARAAKPTPKKQIEFLLSQARIRDGLIHFQDQTQTTVFNTRIENLNLDLRDLDNTSDMPAEIQLDYTTDAGEKLSHLNKIYLSPQFHTEGVISIEGLRPARYTPYFAAFLPEGQLSDGQLDGALNYRLTVNDTAPEFDIAAEQLALHNFALTLKNRAKPAIQIKEVLLKNAHITPKTQTITIESLALTEAALSITREKNGVLDLAALTAGTNASMPDTPRWEVDIAQFTLSDTSLLLEDHTTAKPVTLKAGNIQLQAENISTRKGKEAMIELNALINTEGHARAKGTVVLDPPAAQLNLDFSHIDLRPIQPYTLQHSQIAITHGNLNGQGHLTLHYEKQAQDKALATRFQGHFSIHDFTSFDHLNASDFVRWRALDFAGVTFDLAPLSLSIDNISLNDFRSRLILSQDGELNLRELQATAAPPRTAATPPAAASAADHQKNSTAAKTPTQEAHASSPAPPISIGVINIKNSNVAFSDHFIKPNYHVNLTEMNGHLSGLSSDQNTLAQLDLKGKVDHHAQAVISGKLNPFRQDRHLDILFRIKDFELTSLSGYSGKYVGYDIEKGKLTAELDYKIENRKLSASNHLFLDQLTFGGKTESPDSLNLPIELAVSLLRNRNGEIDFNLPVNGTLDDPEFSISGIVLQAFIQLIGKAITSPFTLLSSIGSSEDISYLQFPSGSATLKESERAKLVTLSQALLDRPTLKLDITGHADPAFDTEGLKHSLLEQQMRTIKLKTLAAEDKPPEALTITEEERPKLIEAVYDQADFKKPRNLFGFTEHLPPAEMEKLILANIKITPEALRTLAQKRASHAEQWLLEQGKIPADRIFLHAPKTDSASDAPPHQVLFSLH